MCPICFDEEKPKNVTVSCGHLFHLDCIMEWWKTTFNKEQAIYLASCPVCRYILDDQEIEYFRIHYVARLYLNEYNKGTLKKWLKKLKKFIKGYENSMEDLLWAPEYVPKKLKE